MNLFYFQCQRTFTKLTKKQILQSIEKYRNINPVGISKYPEENFINFSVKQFNKTIKLQTYRYKQINLKEPKALVFQFHGLKSHQGLGAHIAKYLAENGFCVMGFDHRGQGKSEGLTHYIESLEQHLGDCKEFIRLAEQQYDSKIPKVITGLSMGGMTCYQLALQEPEKYLTSILLAPVLKSVQGRFRWIQANILGLLFPKVKFTAPPKYPATRNPTVVESNEKDIFIRQDEYLRANTSKVLINAIFKCASTFSQFKCPYLLVQGLKDRKIDISYVKDFMSKSAAKKKKLIIKEEMWHDVWQEQEVKEVMPQMVDWINEMILFKNGCK